MRLPFFSVRVVAVLMLLAGLSLGVFAARALHAGRNPTVTPVFDQAIEIKVDLYREYYALDEEQAERVRQTLKEFDAETIALYRRLREASPGPFAALREEMDQRIQAVLKAAGTRGAR